MFGAVSFILGVTLLGVAGCQSLVQSAKNDAIEREMASHKYIKWYIQDRMERHYYCWHYLSCYSETFYGYRSDLLMEKAVEVFDLDGSYDGRRWFVGKILAVICIEDIGYDYDYSRISMTRCVTSYDVEKFRKEVFVPECQVPEYEFLKNTKTKEEVESVRNGKEKYLSFWEPWMVTKRYIQSGDCEGDLSDKFGLYADEINTPPKRRVY